MWTLIALFRHQVSAMTIAQNSRVGGQRGQSRQIRCGHSHQKLAVRPDASWFSANGPVNGHTDTVAASSEADQATPHLAPGETPVAHKVLHIDGYSGQLFSLSRKSDQTCHRFPLA